MATITDDEWQTIYDGLDSASLLAAVQAVDVLRQALNDGDDAPLPPIRDKLLQLHRLAMVISSNATPSLIAEFFELAGEIDDQVDRMMEAVEQLHGTLFAVMVLYPRSLSSDDVKDA